MKERRVVITGFMGSGKTRVALALAQLLACQALDLDEVITERQRRTPALIIEQDGEAAFRDTESYVLQQVLEHHSTQVVALGGGTWTIAGNREMIAQQGCISVWLDAPFELCWKRICAGDAKRPLACNERQARTLYLHRRPLYELASLRIPVAEALGVEQIANLIVEGLSATGKN